MSNETSILLRSEEARTPAAIGVEAAAKYLNAHPPAPAQKSEEFVRHHPEQSIILALTLGFALGWMSSEALFPDSPGR
jgi:ElaB/YqjD/DUF883 family membrane-anchored ribosome-binding protein